MISAFPKMARTSSRVRAAMKAAMGASHSAALATRAVHFATGTRETPVLARDALGAGTVFEGPAILTQLDATTLVPPDWRVTVDASGALLLHKISIS